MSTTSFQRSLFLSLLLGSTTIAGPVQGQVQPSVGPDATAAADADAVQDDDIIVTGSRIVRRDLESAAPVAVVGREEFRLAGAVNAEQIINTLPQVVPGSTAFDNNPGGGVATLDLRALGTNRTLVLVNGRRWVFFDATQVVDINTIPAFLLDSVDVVTGGASAVYGSDAIAGVVNFRLRENLEGVEVGGQYGITERGDGPRYEAYAAVGGELGDGRGHATVYAEYTRRDAIFQSERDFSRATLGEGADGNLSPAGSPTTPNGRFTSTYGAADCPQLNVFCSPGAFFTAPGVSRRRVPTDLFNFGAVNYLMVPQERYLVGGYANYDIGGGHTSYLEATFINNRVANELAATPVTGTFQVNIAAVSPFLSASDIGALRQLDGVATTGNTVGDGVVPISVARRVLEAGGRNSLDERNAFRTLVGLKGPITDKFSYDGYYLYARTRNSNVQNGNVSRSAFQRGLDGTDAPINIFGPGTLTAAMVDQVTILAQNSDVSILQVASASVAGSLFNLGMGADDVGIALGVEYRKHGAEFVPDTALGTGDVIGFNGGQPTEGDYNVKEGFVEVRLPIASDTPGFHKLELSGAFRYSDYSLGNVGGVSTYAGGIEYAPIRDVTFRGQYQRAVRAPNVGELFGGLAQGFPPAIDPCAQAGAATDSVIRALCIATGVPAASVGTPDVQLADQIEGQFGGNPDLQEEVSDSITAGVVLKPSFLPGFSATVDYYNIKVKGAIGALGGGLPNSLSLCYNVIQDINSVYCQAFVGTRNALGQFDGEVPPQILNANVGKLAVEGFDLQVNYNLKLPFALAGEDESRLNFYFLGTYATKVDITPVADLPDEITSCAGRFGTLQCAQPTPKYKWTSRLTWIDGPLTTSVRWRHVGSVQDDDPETEYFTERLKAYDVFDLTLGVDVSERMTFTAGVSNVFDKQPQLIGDNQEQANTYPNVYDVLGRDYFISARLKF